jgi:dTMP kinase
MRLIIIDGLDAVGKDTHAQLIKKRYEKKGERVIIRSHPESDNFYGIKTKKALLGHGKINKLRASVFYMLDVLRSIKKYYGKKDYDTLIMVRYLMGTAYLPPRLSRIAYRLFANFVPTSKYMFFLDAPPDKLLERIKERKEKEMFETLDELAKVRKKALALAENWNIVDTTQAVEKTFAHMEKILDRLDKKS